MNKKASELFAEFRDQGLLTELQGPDTGFTHIDPVETSTSSSLTFVSSPAFAEQAVDREPAVIVTHEKLAVFFATLKSTALLISPNVKLAQALIRQIYDDYDHHKTEWPHIHPSAVIHETAILADDVIIGPGVVIGHDVCIGKCSIVKANCVIGENTSIGEDCLLFPCVVIAHACQIGDRVVLKAGCTIGMEGYGFAQDAKGRSHRIPQAGIVVIGDDVLLGAQCNVDRATWGETRIRAGCKLDAFCHIAHNVDVGEDCIITAQFSIAGSSTLGKRVMVSGQCGVIDHINIADDVALVQRAGVINDISEPGIYAGTPVQPVKDYFRNRAVAHKLTDLRKRVRQLERQIDELANSNSTTTD